MFNLSPDDRLSAWAKHRHQLENSSNPFDEVIAFWKESPYVPYNRKVDPFNQRSWPTPWDIIVDNKYDDFTKALMIAWSLKLTDKFKNSRIEIKTYTDRERPRQYNLVFVDDDVIINYNDNDITLAKDLPDSLQLENLIEISRPR